MTRAYDRERASLLGGLVRIAAELGTDSLLVLIQRAAQLREGGAVTKERIRTADHELREKAERELRAAFAGEGSNAHGIVMSAVEDRLRADADYGRLAMRILDLCDGSGIQTYFQRKSTEGAA